MFTPQQILKKAELFFPTYLSNIVSGNDSFPYEVRFGKIKTTADYSLIKQYVDKLNENSKKKRGYGYTVHLKEQNTRKYHIQSLPRYIYFETEKDYLKYIGKIKEAEKFKKVAQTIEKELPELKEWIQNNPNKVINHIDDWDSLVKVCRYFLKNPQPALYIRELPIEIHTKFIEKHKGILKKLLEYLLPESEVKRSESGFEKRFHLKYEEPLIRVRLLDTQLQSKYNIALQDFQIPYSEFCSLNFKSEQLIITENKMNFLTLPFIEKTIGIWGSGAQISLLKNVTWFKNIKIIYWGDIDAQGFQILSQMRSNFPQTISAMMDRHTFDDFQLFAVDGTPDGVSNPPCLTEKENDLFQYVCENNLRLEQEKIDQKYAIKKLMFVAEKTHSITL